MMLTPFRPDAPLHHEHYLRREYYRARILWFIIALTAMMPMRWPRERYAPMTSEGDGLTMMPRMPPRMPLVILGRFRQDRKLISLSSAFMHALDDVARRPYPAPLFKRHGAEEVFRLYADSRHAPAARCEPRRRACAEAYDAMRPPARLPFALRCGRVFGGDGASG